MEYRHLITLTTDFGYKDPFVAIMKGVILQINPSVRMIDVTHKISPQNIQEAAFVLEMCLSSFPRRTINVVVVDPGVGSERRPILVTTENHFFVGPDNGVFSRIYRLSENPKVFHITAEHYFLPQKSATFHGRDIFAPVAAWLSRDIKIANFGDLITDFVTLPAPAPLMSDGNIIEGEVIYIDRFGNLTTNIDAQTIDGLKHEGAAGNPLVAVKGLEVPLKKFYSEAEDKKLCCLINSFGYLELFVKGGNASSDFGIQVGEPLKMISA